MATSSRSWARQSLAALRMLVLFTVVFGIGYPAVVWGVGRVAFHDQATGSLVKHDGRVVGSSLLGQQFTGPTWFHGRNSASQYAGNASGGTNLPESDKRLTTAVAAARKAAGPIGSTLPPDALTTSASGLDPHISPAYADLQAPGIAAARKVSVTTVRALITKNTSGRVLGYLGEPRVNVLELNLALTKLGTGSAG